ncbi:MAG TPA: hypothetical protein VEQ85_15095 [Lacipirellulaceae bacterium]|nr:hypothetical protein [Lacipirellulaceae bacterium]
MQTTGFIAKMDPGLANSQVSVPPTAAESEQAAMYDVLHAIVEIPPPFNMVVLVAMIGTCGALLGNIAVQVRKFACYRQELQYKRDLVEFKRELLDRAMTVDEVERLVRAQSAAGNSLG